MNYRLFLRVLRLIPCTLHTSLLDLKFVNEWSSLTNLLDVVSGLFSSVLVNLFPSGARRGVFYSVEPYLSPFLSLKISINK